MQLAREQVHAQVAVLAGLGRVADADDLRGTTLEKEDVTDADEVALNGDSSASESSVDTADLVPWIAAA